MDGVTTPTARRGHPARGRAAATGAAGRKRRRGRFLPPQHGAWAMLAVPFAAGLVAAGYRWLDLPLLAAWLAGYLLSYYALLAVKSRRPARYRAQLLLYGALTAVPAAIVLSARPRLLWYAPAYAALAGVNAWYAWRRDERALLNDVASVAQSCLMVFVVATVAAVAPRAVWGAFLACLAYFLGTVLYVKTMIRERDNVPFRRWSIGYHLLALAVTAWLSPWFAALFAWLAARSALFPRLRLAPLRVGLVELANCVLLLACVALLR